jgi:flavin reductase (DIM6/NTAB) family NADH-FMN oxidoreductase RutF
MTGDADRLSWRDLSRQQFRRYFQPSRIVLGVFVSSGVSDVNVITLCFNMHCSYRPPMMAFSIQRGAHSYELLESAAECVLAVPGESLAEEALYCGVVSGRDVDKVRECDLGLISSSRIATPGIARAIANVELSITGKMATGDHLTAVGTVQRYCVNVDADEKCLLSVGPQAEGYRVLARKGIHRIGVVEEA